ncbi:hypothetical protein B0H13DRAFT_2325012 [Mycena leptocephala]|nr:hypothetical protein B0H13DRAFT_2325012 [Mycena leptocephala]
MRDRSRTHSSDTPQGKPGWTLPDIGGPYSPPPAGSSLPSTAPHLLQPPYAPRMRNVPLPAVYGGPIAMLPAATHREPFPIDLRSDLDLEHLTQALGNHRISSHSTVHVLPTARDRPLIQLRLGDEPTTSITLIRRLHAVMCAPLSLRVYRSELSPDVQQAVCGYFVARSEPNGRRLWQDFLNGHHHPQGPKGEDLLQGHFLLWGVWQDGHAQWVVDADVPRPPVRHTPHVTNSY